MPDTNPIKQVHQALWTLLLTNSDFASAVPEGNRIDYSGTTAPKLKTATKNKDFPEVRIAHAMSRYHLDKTSDSSHLWILFQVQIKTDDETLGDVTDLEWAVYRTMTQEAWEAVLGVLAWNEKTFVRDVSLGDAKSALGSRKQAPDRGIRGWRTLVSGEVEMYFTTADLAVS